ncbi:MAG: Uma2 family endonuclease [Desulfobacterales bacterium]
MQQPALNYITEEEYLAMERESEIRHEYYDGEIFAMAGASRKHNLITANVIRELGNQLRNTGCRVYPSDMRVKIEATGLYTYPDVLIVCGEEIFADEKEDMLLNPAIIIEVLSDSTESYDRGRKFENYRMLNSLKEYILISQNRKKMERFFRNERGYWELDESDEENPQLHLQAAGCELRIADVYENVWEKP